MTGLMYCGKAAPQWCAAEVLEPAAHALAPQSTEVPGLPGAKLLGCAIPPRDVVVRLWPDLGPDADPLEVEAAKRELRLWLLAEGGTLALPGGIEYRNAVATEAGMWPLGPDDHVDVTFTCFDPIGYGEEATSATEAFELGGDWPSLPTVRGKSDGSARIEVTRRGDDERTVGISRGFAEGDELMFDFEDRRITSNGADVTAYADVGCDWFAIGPGAVRMEVSGLKDWSVTCRERWA